MNQKAAMAKIDSLIGKCESLLNKPEGVSVDWKNAVVLCCIDLEEIKINLTNIKMKFDSHAAYIRLEKTRKQLHDIDDDGLTQKWQRSLGIILDGLTDITHWLKIY